MKVIVAGSRDITDRELVFAAIESSGFTITEVVSGKCRGVDTIGEEWAAANGIPVKPFPPSKAYHPKVAPLVRNTAMAKYADALIAIRHPMHVKSNGTDDMIQKAKDNNLKIFIMISGDT